jgi:hypothetical protein
VSIYSDKKIAAELRNIGGNFLLPKIYQNCEAATVHFCAPALANSLLKIV